MHDSDTIFALSTGVGKTAIAVIRISGARAASAIETLTGRPPPPERQAALRALRDPISGEIVDRGLVLWFPRPRSETGEDVVELHVHGGRAVLSGIFSALSRMDGFRIAEPGEFARRAFRKGKLDLTSVEGLADLIDAETAAQRRQALQQMDGALASLYEGWRSRLLHASALIEAYIDFADEGITESVIGEALGQLSVLGKELSEHLDDGRRSQAIRDGIRVAILGAPNVGKSSLLNALARRDAAIVTPVAGTTRDVVEVHLDLGGWPIILADTAGLRDSSDVVEVEGIRRAQVWSERADLKIVVFDATTLPAVDSHSLSLLDVNTLPVFNKTDRAMDWPRNLNGLSTLGVSALKGTGFDVLESSILARVQEDFAATASPSLTRERHRTALLSCLDRIKLCEPGLASELLAENCRNAAFALGRLTGAIAPDDLLDVIFRDFCIGK